MQDIWDRLFHKEAEESSDTDKYLIVGLGNPGREHKGNRHNIGFMAIDSLAETCGISLGKVQNKALTGNGRCANQPVILAKPQTYMNRSGDAIGSIAAYYHIPPQKVLVIYDELDLALGTIRLREKGGTGGHNGMKSIVNHLGQEFPRMRLGIGRPSGKMSPAAYVLQDFGKDDLPIVADMLDEAVRAVETFIRDGINLAMTRHNTQRKQDE
jgi:PTH1 family peptidyl-tRNA hydrolase